jgi:hypothetical protein
VFDAPVRKDLEFFIPQLCSFYLQGIFGDTKSLVNLIVQASKSDFYFSHRIWFFFQSVVFTRIIDPAKQE